jgi:hypothetical protein
MYDGGKKDEDREEIAQNWAWPSSHRLLLDERGRDDSIRQPVDEY